MKGALLIPAAVLLLMVVAGPRGPALRPHRAASSEPGCRLRPGFGGPGSGRSLLRDVPQRATAHGRSRARRDERRQRGAGAGDVGEGRAQGAHRHDAARRRAAARSCGARSLRRGRRRHHRSRGRIRPQSGRARTASHEPHRVRQRRTGFARPADRRDGPASRRRFERGLRQPGQRAQRLSGVDAGVRDSGGKDQPSRNRRPDDQCRPHHLSRAARDVAGPASRGAAARHTRRHRRAARLPARRRVRVQSRRAPAADSSDWLLSAPTTRSRSR